jgi:hypothetical protein
MLRAEGLLMGGQGALVKGLGVGLAALGVVQQGEVVEALADVGMLRPEGLLAIARERL